MFTIFKNIEQEVFASSYFKGTVVKRDGLGFEDMHGKF
jgi:hypothetical protein